MSIPITAYEWRMREQRWPLVAPPWHQPMQEPPYMDVSWQVGYEDAGNWRTITTFYDRAAAAEIVALHNHALLMRR